MPVTLHSPKVDAYFNENGGTVYRFIGYPFKSPIINPRDGQAVDLRRSRFTENTDVGSLQRTFPALFEHGLFPEIGFDELGTCRIAGKDKRGFLMDMAIKKSNEYHDFMEQLYHAGLLQFSGQSYGSGYELAKNGDIARFIAAEGSGVLTAANLYAVPIDAQQVLFRSVGVDDYEVIRSYYSRGTMEENQNTTGSTSTETPSQSEQGSTSLVADVQAILDQAAKPDDPNLVLLRSVVTSLDAVNAAQAQQVEAAKSYVTADGLKELETRLTAQLDGSIKTINEAIKLLAGNIAQSTQVATTRSMLETLSTASPAEAADLRRSAADLLRQSQSSPATNTQTAQSQPQTKILPIPDLLQKRIGGSNK